MKNTPLDIITWPTMKEGHEDDLTEKRFEFYFQNQNVGKCSIRLLKNAWGLYDEKRFFPKEWFIESKKTFKFFGTQSQLKPILEITKFNFEKFQGKGFGRMGLQKMYQISQKLGTEGRITLDAEKEPTSLRDPATFYEHCGFKGNEGIDGRKYFNPTPENIALLFSKPLNPLFKMKEVAVPPNQFIDPKTGNIKIPLALQKILNRQRG